MARRMIRCAGDNGETESPSAGTAVSWTPHSSELGRQLGQAVPQNPSSQQTKASLSSGLGVRHSSHLLPTPVPGTPTAVEK